MSEFLDKLTVLLNEVWVEKEDIKIASEMIREAYWYEKIVSGGPCFLCEELIVFKTCQSHRCQGDKWYKKFRSSMRKNKSLTIEGKGPRINGYDWKRIKGYFCTECQEDIEEQISSYEKKVTEQRKQEREENHRRYLEDLPKIISGEIESKVWQRMNALNCYMTEQRIKELKSLPYKEFLQTDYWEIVRLTMLKRAKFRCSLCNAKRKLHVHHRTYERHGFEHLHYWEDLIVLCETCHARHHGVCVVPE